MDEIERIEQRKPAVFSLTALAAFVIAFLALHDLHRALLTALPVALLVAGGHAARQLTAEPTWSCLDGEARLAGRRVRGWQLWLGNLLPGLAAAVGAAWWMGR